jgi:hypothetical protein
VFKLTLTLVFVAAVLIFSFRLLETPSGITVDEAGFGYNASLISETFRDENGRFLPVFVLSLEGRDWRQPVMQYSQVLAFKVFGNSLFVLKFVSVIFAAASAMMIFFLADKLGGRFYAWIAFIVFVTTPIVFMHSHLALDNIAPLPFIILWLISLCKYERKKDLKYLIVAGVSLGVGFYAHKSMRSASSVWTLVTLIYLYLPYAKKGLLIEYKNVKPLVVFAASVFPFFAISPLLEYKYAGAVYGSQSISIKSIFDYFYYYLSNFDPSFLFIKGDSILHHSTGKHGMFLLSLIPFFIYGIYSAFKNKDRFLILVVASSFTGPLFVALVGSAHRASRILFETPLFALITAYGFISLMNFKARLKNFILVLSIVLFAINAGDFLVYYWFEYPKETAHIFYNTRGEKAYKELSFFSRNRKLTPYIDESLVNRGGDPKTVEDFLRSMYFIHLDILPAEGSNKGIVLTDNKKFNKGELISNPSDGYYIYLFK